MSKNKIIVASIIFVVLVLGFVTQQAAFGESGGNDEAFVVQEVEVAEVVVEPVVETTTTTIDLSFLNTTTTQYIAPKVSQPIVEPNYDPSDGSRWDQLAQCESGGNWAYPTVAGGFSGGIMFHEGTWNANGGQEYAQYAYMATREQQILIAEKVLAGSGWGAWPGCSRKYGWL
jgi:hypothetical protein